MTVNRTTLLDLPLPVTGTESGTWGDTTNNGLTQYVDIAVAGMTSLTSANFTAGALTISNTTGDSSATNIAAGSAQYGAIKVSSLATNSTITAPSSNRRYTIINADATYSVTIKASGQTGVTIVAGEKALVAFNGTDYVKIATANGTGEFTTVDTTNLEVTNIKAKDGTAAATIADSTGVVTVTAAPVMTALTASQAVFTTSGKALTSNAITGTGNVVMSASPTLTGTISAAAATLSGNLTLSGGTANGVLYLDGSKVATSGSGLVFDGTNLGLGVTPSAWGSGQKAIDIATAGGIRGDSFTVGINQNCYYNGTNWIYRLSTAASKFECSSGVFGWYTAASGTAGNTISFIQAMTLDANGVLMVGSTTPGSDRVRIKASNTTGSSIYNYLNCTNEIDSDLQIRITGSAATDKRALIITSTNTPIAFGTNGTERARITSGGDLQISSGGSFQVGGTAARATTAGTNRVDIFNGTAPVGTLTNGISLYSSSGEAYVMDAAGNATLFSPHDAQTNEWIFKSKHTPTGKVLKIDVEKLLRFVNDHFGLDAVHEFVES